MNDKRKMDSNKALYHMDRIISHYDKGEQIAPVHIDWGLTKICNANCIFCYAKWQESSIGKKGNKDIIDKDILLNAIKEAGKEGVRSIAFIGDGEPTLNPAFYGALRIGKNVGISMATSTNGILLDDEYKRRTILENCEWMRFSLSAGTKEGYKLIHRVDKFDTVKKNIEDLLDMKYKHGYKTDIGLQSVFVPTLMAQEMVEEAKLAKELGIDYFVIKQCSLPDPNGNSGMMNFNINDYDKLEVIDKLKEAESYSNDKTKIVVKWDTIKNKGIKNYNGCQAVPLISEISGNGDWYPGGCFFGKGMLEYRLGNLNKQSFSEILHSERYWNIVEKMKKFPVQSAEICKGACRLDGVNKFISDYLEKPQGVNFI